MRKFTWLATILILAVITYSVIDIVVITPEIRSALNQKQRTITFGRGYPVGMKDGDMQVRMVPGKGPTLYAKVGGLVVEWLGKWQRETPEKRIYRQIYEFGYAALIEAPIGSSTTVGAKGPDSVYYLGGGFRMHRNGRAVGGSFSFEGLVNATGGYAQATFIRDGSSTIMVITVNYSGGSWATEYGTTTGNFWDFSAGDRVWCNIKVASTGASVVRIQNVLLALEIEVSERKP